MNMVFATCSLSVTSYIEKLYIVLEKTDIHDTLTLQVPHSINVNSKMTLKNGSRISSINLKFSGSLIL